MDIKHVGLSQSERRKLAGMISKGIPFDDILNNVRDSLSSLEMSRLHLVVRRDLLNIAHEFHLSKIQHKKDAAIVRDWVDMCRQENSDLVRFIKYQGEEVMDDSQDERIALDDFMIVLMNNVQVYMLQQYGHHRVNCMDSTRGMNVYDFQLTTLMIIDDYGEVFPVAFCISSKVDTRVMEVFLKNVRTAIGGSVNGALLMTDDSPAYVNAWRSVMGPTDHHILSTWHIDRNWKKNLAKINHSTEATMQVYNMLLALLKIDNKVDFHCLLETSLREMEADEGMAEFLSYFRQSYVSRPEVWACSYQLGLPCHHNVRLDEFHETLKRDIIQAKKVLKLVKCCTILVPSSV